MRCAVVGAMLSLAGVSMAFAADLPLAEKEWRVDGVARKALVYVPATATKADTPVVFAFHGHSGNMRNAAEKFGYHRLWPQVLVVYMQGLPTPGKFDPEGKTPGWQKTVGDQKDRDLKFFDQVLATLKKDYRVDGKRVYATGHSNRGGFTYLLWAERGDVFAAVAPSAGVARPSRNRKPLPVLHVAGRNDETVPFVGQKRVMAAVRTLNGCDTDGKPWAKLVIVYAGGEGQNGLIAFDALSGSIAWAVPGRGMNFSSALVATLDGERTVVFVDGSNAKGLAPIDGRELWRYPISAGGAAPIVQPQQIGPSSLAVPLGDGVGIARIEITRSSTGSWDVQETWRSRDLKPSFNDFVRHGDYLSGFDKPTFVCLDARTGQRKWKRGRYGFGQAIALASAGQILVTTEQGEVVAIDASPESSVERGRGKVLGGKTWNHPVVVGNRMYLRNAEEMVYLKLGRD
jgi:polyhydroxybutyrate depolymerase